MFLHILPLVVVCAFATGCAESGPNSGLATVRMKIGTETYKLEIANTEDSRRTGLMRRDAMPADRGMIFSFDEERILQFHMLNTRIPLDILFLDAGGRVVSIHEMKPYDTKTDTRSARPAKYAIELNRGQIKVSGVKPGDVLEIPASAREPVD